MASSLQAVTLMEIWERGRQRHPVDRALVVLAFAHPEQHWDELAALPIGERNRRLLGVRAACFGQRLDIVASCPHCAAALEFEFEFPLQEYDASQSRYVELGVPDYGTLRARLPDSRDLAAVASMVDPAAARRCLLDRCIEPAPTKRPKHAPHPEGDPTTARADPAEPLKTEFLAKALSAAVERHDPLASIVFPVRCTDCGNPWRATLDPIEYLWGELEQHVRTIVGEVDLLARAYGWSESEILGLSSARRRLYLEQARSQSW